MIKLFFKVSEAYPGRYAGLYWKVKEASILTERNGISSVISGKLNINADKADSSVPLFSCTFVSNEPKKSWLSSYSTSSIALIVQVLCKKTIYLCNFCKGIHIPFTVEERASKRFNVNNLAETYILSTCGYI